MLKEMFRSLPRVLDNIAPMDATTLLHVMALWLLLDTTRGMYYAESCNTHFAQSFKMSDFIAYRHYKFASRVVHSTAIIVILNSLQPLNDSHLTFTQVSSIQRPSVTSITRH